MMPLCVWAFSRWRAATGHFLWILGVAVDVHHKTHPALQWLCIFRLKEIFLRFGVMTNCFECCWFILEVLGQEWQCHLIQGTNFKPGVCCVQ